MPATTLFRRFALTRVTAVAAVAALLALAAPSAAAPTATAAAAGHHGGPKPTIVIEHGAFADGSSFAPVTERLQHDGYTVLVPANPLRGIVSDAAYLRSVLDTVPGPIVLVGHSYGGAVISQAADGDAAVKALVFVAAFLPDVGETVSQTNADSQDVQLTPASLDFRPFPGPGGTTGVDAYVKVDQFPALFAADLPGFQARELAASQRPVDPANAFAVPLTAAAWHTIPSWCVVPRQDVAIGTDALEAMAARAHCHTVETRGSHLVMLSHPRTVTGQIEAAARATAG
jgi:pimeloyl-ACP methyl ester carboxylesterase